MIRNQQGFTLAEMLVVLAILALTVTFALPSLRSSPDDAIDAVAQDVAEGLTAARLSAIKNNRDQTFLFDKDKRLFFAGNGESAVRLPSDAAIEILAAKPARSQRGIGFTFFADGSSTGGSVSIRQDGKERVVNVAWLTGLTSIAKGQAQQ